MSLAARVAWKHMKAQAETQPFDAPGNKINAIAKEWVAKNPDLGHRIYRAVAFTGSIEQASDRKTFFVEGQNETYTVHVDPSTRTSTCTCPDSTQRGSKCKHALAVALVYAARGNRLA